MANNKEMEDLLQRRRQELINKYSNKNSNETKYSKKSDKETTKLLKKLYKQREELRNKEKNKDSVPAFKSNEIVKSHRRKAIIKSPGKIFKKALKMLGGFTFLGLGGFSLLYTGNVATQEIVNKVQTNEVNKALDYYGGIGEYIGTSGIFNSYTKFETNNTKDIRIGFAPSVDKETEAQLAICFNYMNDMFNVINPNYHFNLYRVDNEKDCDVFFELSDVKTTYPEIRKYDVAVTYDRQQKNRLSYFKKGSANVIFNVNYVSDHQRLRFAALHEIEHFMLDNNDLTYNKEAKYNHYTVPFSVLSYSHASLMSTKYGYPNTYEANKEYIQEEFVSYTPFDIAAYAARYGDLNNEENKKACTQLIVDTYNNCKSMFGDRNYFLKDVELNTDGYPVKFEKYINENTVQSYLKQNASSSLSYKPSYTKVEYEEEREN